ncbi:MAG: adenosylcobalamin-dependent ribonucleoside-diphosphate reductase [Bacillota bacterium]|nr:adenosylcobalamin-dependent ribonucleoside-diphosphate reductase [Bacillota bacterium]
MGLTANAIKVLEKRYLTKNEEGVVVETPEEMFRRVARSIAMAEKAYDSGVCASELEERFYSLMENLEFIPNSPTLMNAGKDLGQLSACFVLPVEDSMEGIFDAIKQAAIIHKSGGGTGFSFARLRPAGSTVQSTGGVASGPISFMKVFNAATEAVKQGGVRRGANMGILRVDHPDIVEFIQCKKDNKEITNFNISVALTEEFMKAVEDDDEYPLVDPKSKQAVKWIRARDIFELIVEMAWKNGEPGIIFIDRINRDNVLFKIGDIESTNPCVAGDTWVLTNEGPKQVNDIIGKALCLALDGKYYETTQEGFFETGTKPVIRISTDRGYELKVTEDHLIRTAAKVTRDKVYGQWKRAGELKEGEHLILSNNRGIKWEGKGSYNQGYLLGLLLGDGTLKDEENLAALRDLAEEYGMLPGDKKINAKIEKTGYEFHKGFLRGLFDADGTVIGTQKKGVSIRLWQKDIETLKAVQRMLHRLGIASTIYYNRKAPGDKLLPDGKGGYKEYKVQAGHEMVISGDNIAVFSDVVGFSNIKKNRVLLEKMDSYKRDLNRERFTATVTKCMRLTEEQVYDVQVPQVNAFDANGVYVHNCGEQPLLPYESCNLGSINLVKMLKQEGDKQVIDYERLGEVIDTAVHFLDNVIDINKYPLEVIEKATKGSRKIGLGVMGFADMLIMLGIPYDSDEAIQVAEEVMAFINRRSKEKSRELALAKGKFPLYEDSTYAREGIELRNATTTTIAPTGTISIIAGVSSGIEPLFAISFIRNVMDKDHLPEVHPIFEKVARQRGFYSEELMKEIARKGTLKDIEGVPEDVKKIFVTAHDISPEWHIRMQAAFQKFTDNAVSKTVNFSRSASREDVRKAYLLAYRLGCKGITIYRDGSREEQVLNIGQVNDKVKESEGTRKETIAPRVRPEITRGVTEKVRIGCGNLYITVNYDDSGICEVFTNLGRAGGCPSQSEATSRLISIALRSGMDVKSIVEQLKGIRCHATIRQKANGNGVKVLSCPDAIGKALERVMKMDTRLDLTVENDTYCCSQEQQGIGSEAVCPECGSRLEHESGCVVCRGCGFSKCG